MNARAISAAAAVTAACALATAGCGSGGADPASATLGGGAAVVPSDAVAFVAVDTGASSAQWQAAGALLAKFPSSGGLIAKLRTSLEQKTKLSWNDDIRPALGDELDLAVLPGATPQLVGLAQPSDSGKLDALLAKADSSLVTRKIGGWTVFSTSPAALDAVAAAKTSLADDTAYGHAVAGLAGDALLRAYANGAEARQLLTAVAGQTGATGAAASAPTFQWVALELVAEKDGLRLHATLHAPPPPPQQLTPSLPQAYTPTLPDEIPAGALFVADFQYPAVVSQLATGALPAALQALLGRLGHSIPSDLDTILGGETALYVRPGLPIPEVTIVTEPADTAQARRALADLATALHGSPQPGGFKLGSVSIVDAVIGGELVISTSRKGISDFEGGGSKLSSDADFTAAKQASGMPGQVTGFVYVDIKAALPFIEAFAASAGASTPSGLQSADLAPLQAFTAYGTRSGDDSSFTAFIGLK